MGQFLFFALLLGMLALAFAVSAVWQRSRILALLLALAVPIAAGGLYWFKGAPAAPGAPLAGGAAPAKTIDQAIVQLEQLVKANPANFGDQATLARAYMAAQEWDKARAAYARALALQDDVDLSVEYAEALLRSSPDHRFPPQAVRLLELALQKSPENQRALFFYGMHQRQSGQPAEAAATWQRLLALVDPASAIELRRDIDVARKEAGLPPLPAAKPTIDVEVRLDPTLARAAGTGTVLYVFARRSDGEGPPLAVKRLKPEAFPVHLQLGDEDSPMPAAKLSAQRQVLLEARLSQSGDALPASGDLEADPVQVEVAEAAKAELLLNRSVP